MAQDFAAWLASALEGAGLSQSALARALDLDRSTITNWLARKRSPGLPVLYRVADALGVPVATVLEAAGEHEAAARERGKPGHESLAATLRTVRSDLGHLPMRPSARSALAQLATELSRTAPEIVEHCYDRAAEQTLRGFAAGVHRQLSPGELTTVIQVEMRRHFVRELGRATSEPG